MDILPTAQALALLAREGFLDLDACLASGALKLDGHRQALSPEVANSSIISAWATDGTAEVTDG
jgi:hypothetical protein